jgi:hypothetical protein
MVDHSQMKLGRKPVKHDKRTLRLARYLTGRQGQPQPPEQVAWSMAVSKWDMLLNDSLGDCTIAGLLHLFQCMVANSGAGSDPFIPTDAEALAGYEQLCGYNPADPSTDHGGNELDILNAVRKNGLAGQSVSAFVAVDFHNQAEVETAIDLFGGIYVGIALPQTAKKQEIWQVTPWYDVWDGSPTPGSWGGHSVVITDYDQLGLSAITWGIVKRMTWDWFNKYMEECYALISLDWLNSKGQSPTGLNISQLTADLQEVTA